MMIHLVAIKNSFSVMGKVGLINVYLNNSRITFGIKTPLFDELVLV